MTEIGTETWIVTVIVTIRSEISETGTETFFGRSYGRSHAPRPPSELRHYEPSCGDDYMPPPRRFDPDDRRGAVRIPSLDDRPEPPPSDDRRPSFDDCRPPPPPVPADDRRLTLDDRLIRRLPAQPLTLGCSRQLLTTVLVQLVIPSHSLGQPQGTIGAPVLPRLRVTAALEPVYHWKRGFRNPRSRPPSKTVCTYCRTCPGGYPLCPKPGRATFFGTHSPS